MLLDEGSIVLSNFETALLLYRIAKDVLFGGMRRVYLPTKCKDALWALELVELVKLVGYLSDINLEGLGHFSKGEVTVCQLSHRLELRRIHPEARSVLVPGLKVSDPHEATRRRLVVHDVGATVGYGSVGSLLGHAGRTECRVLTEALGNTTLSPDVVAGIQ